MFVNTYSYEPISKTDISNIVIMMHHCEGLTKKNIPWGRLLQCKTLPIFLSKH